jgi:hypothetical protein
MKPTWWVMPDSPFSGPRSDITSLHASVQVNHHSLQSLLVYVSSPFELISHTCPWEDFLQFHDLGSVTLSISSCQNM